MMVRFAPYGSEQRVVSNGTPTRLFYALFGDYDLGARVRYAAIKPELKRLPAPRRILDAGSGRGLLACAMARRWPQAQILGIDMDVEPLERAHKVAAAAGFGDRVRFKLETLPGQIDEPAELITCVDVLEHVEDDAGFLRSLFEATVPGGTLILHTPADPQRRYLAEFEEQHDHVRDGYSAADLRSLFEAVGYDDVRVAQTFGMPAAIGWEIFALARQGNPVARAALPASYVLGAVGASLHPKQGNGLLVAARRPG